MNEKKFFDFRSGENFNLDEQYTAIFGTSEFKPDNPGEAKLKDAGNIINELGAKYIEGLSLQKYEEIFVNLNEFAITFPGKDSIAIFKSLTLPL